MDLPLWATSVLAALAGACVGYLIYFASAYFHRNR
jgi:hypothetical protein